MPRALTLEQKEAAAVIAQLRAHRDRLEHLFKLSIRPVPLNSTEQKEAQVLFKIARGMLRADDKRMSSVSGRQTLNPTEAAVLRPAIRDASAAIRGKWNSKAPKWQFDLYRAIAELDFHLQPLEKRQAPKAFQEGTRAKSKQ